MQVSHKVASRNSEETFARRLQILSDAGAGVIHVRTHEVIRATVACRKAVLLDNGVYREWDVAHGFRQFDLQNMNQMTMGGDNMIDLMTALSQPITAIPDSSNDEEHMHYFVFVNPQYWLENNPIAHHHIQQACHILPSTNVRMVLVTPDAPLPSILADTVTTLFFEPPGHAELMDSVATVLDGVDGDVLDDLDDNDKVRIAYAGAGMSKDMFETYLALSVVESAAGEDEVSVETLVQGVNSGKTDVVNRNDLLELYRVESMEHVGGMENLKTWIRKRANCYSDEAREFGIEPPKGMVFVGPPGTGKSLAAKAVSSVLGVPLIRLDFGRVFNSLVGKSEERIRLALRMVESMAPCVLFVDEIDKGLGGIGGSGDSGTSNRVLGTFLTWLNDNETPVFTMVTANNIMGLPPEMMRRGRFDAIFATGLPTEEERLAVLDIHLEKRGWDSAAFSRKEKQAVINASKGYVPAEIESAVKDALINAFAEGEDLTMDYVVDALREMTPLSKSYAEAIQVMTAWAHANAIPASKRYDTDEIDTSNVAQLGVRKTRVRSKTPEDEETKH
jgi:AAA+ superfamily predicted ATPase